MSASPVHAPALEAAIDVLVLAFPTGLSGPRKPLPGSTPDGESALPTDESERPARTAGRRLLQALQGAAGGALLFLSVMSLAGAHGGC